MMPHKISSRLGFGAGLTILSGAASAQGTAANNKINLSLIGCGGRGTDLINGFHKREQQDVHVVSCCDIRKDRGERAAAAVGAKYTDEMRAVLDDKSVDAVVVALPDHWHALATFWACQAGKDVYVEKPASHSAFEGQKCVEAARKYKRIVQHGTQNRSAPYNFAAKKYIEDGKLGDIHLCRVYNVKAYGGLNIKPDERIPEGFDYDRWLGPVPMRPYSSAVVGHGWHHLLDFSAGDMADDGIHQFDLARWLIGKEIPKSVYSAGGRFAQKDDADVPDTLISSYEFDDMTVTFELASYPGYMFKIGNRNEDLFPYPWMQCATRIEIFGTKGLMVAGRHGGGWEVYDRPKNRQPVVRDLQHGRFPDPEHKENFLQCLRSRELPNADIEKGHRSTMLVHYATISHRLGGVKLDIDTEDGTIKNHPDAAKYWKREYRKPYEITEEV
ncbi:MAG: Gfo/Idh/MocA family oxidoreductase [Planctomycetaceae bacterium]|jgi:predicted dehydrogenase|nr:Gfo/Idh/MocA family oxidoreductase [Planctomycetaceae bacterium]